MVQPTVLWAQRDDFIWITVEVPNAENLNVDLSSKQLKFSCKADGKELAFDLTFFAPIVQADSKFLKHRMIDFALKKETEQEWPRLIEENKKCSWIKVDWSKWQDSDAEDEPQPFDMSSMGGMGGMGGMEGLGGMMGGMGGAGGMGGMEGLAGMMGGMGGMGGMPDFSAFGEGEGDSDDEGEDVLPDLPAEEQK